VRAAAGVPSSGQQLAVLASLMPALRCTCTSSTLRKMLARSA